LRDVEQNVCVICGGACMCGDVGGCGLHTPVWTGALLVSRLLWSGRIVWCGEGHGNGKIGWGMDGS